MKKFTVILVSVFIILSSSLAVTMEREESVGVVRSVSGEVFISSSANPIVVKAYPNMKIRQGDVITTGAKSSAGLIFDDDTVVSLGSQSEFTIDDFTFNPVKKDLSFVARLLRGTYSLITGQIAKLAPKKVRIITPDATLGVRGTKLLIKVD